MKYVVKFSKTGDLRYISHLDTMRLFQRAFKRAGIGLLHSQGFNPHPRMILALPLPLGCESRGEYLEFHTADAMEPSVIKERLEPVLPRGIGLLFCAPIPEAERKNLAAQVVLAGYRLESRCDPAFDWREALNAYLSQESILGERRQKKTKSYAVVNIKPWIKEFSLSEAGEEGPVFSALLSAGSGDNLNPEVLLKSFFQWLDRPYLRWEHSLCRTELYKSDGNGGFCPLFIPASPAEGREAAGRSGPESIPAGAGWES